MLNINYDYNLSLYFEFFTNYLNQFDVSILEKNELIFFNEFFIKNFFLIFSSSDFFKIFTNFSSQLSNFEIFTLIINFEELKLLLEKEIDMDIDENYFFFIYLLDINVYLNSLYSFIISFIFFINSLISNDLDNLLLSSFSIDLIYHISISYVLDYDIFNLKNYFNFIDSVDTNIFNYFVYNIIFYLSTIWFIGILNFIKLPKTFDLFFFKFFFFINNFSKTNRLNFDLIFISFLFLIESLLFTIMQVNDNSIEFVEFLHIQLIYFLIIVIIYLIYKYSIHYFSFLEQSVIEGKSSLFILKQFIRDTSNTFALFLRFFLLLFRLNIYDGLDDFLDSYCVFFCEFNENIEITSISYIFIDNVINNFDLFLDDMDSNSNELYFGFYYDIFNLFLINFIEILNYWLFLLEEIFRVFLAFYIIYLIVFEVHSVNLSYIEDNYFYFKK